MTTVGVLALQGAFAKHMQMLRSLNVTCVDIRKPQDLQVCDALIIPGGESTTMMKQMQFIDLVQPILDFATLKPIFGTCAGLILMSNHIMSDPMQPFNLLDVEVERNAYGRQIESFSAEFAADLGRPLAKTIKGLFIRAPRIRRCGPEIQVLASLDNEPILVRQGMHLGATFHPELTDCTAVHRYFLDVCLKNK